MATFSDFLKNFREAANVAKSFDESVPKGTYTDAHLESENGGGYSINYTPIDSSNTRKHSVLSDVDGYKAVTDASLNNLKDRQSRDDCTDGIRKPLADSTMVTERMQRV